MVKMMMRKYLLLCGLLFLLAIPPSSVAEESSGWTLRYRDKPIQAELLDVTADNTDHFRSSKAEKIPLTFWSPERYDRFLFGFASVPDQLDVYAIQSDAESRLLVSIHPKEEMFTIDLPPYEEETLQFVCAYQRKQTCIIDMFLPLQGAETLSLPHVAADSEADALVVLPTVNMEDGLLTKLQETLLDHPKSTIAVLEKTKPLQRHRLIFRLWQQGVRWNTLFANFPTWEEGINKNQLLKLWKQKDLDVFFSAAIRAQKPLYLLFPAGDTEAAAFLEEAVARGREISVSAGWDRQTAATTGVWHVPFLLSFPLDGPLPAITRREAQEQTKQVLLAALEISLASEAADLAAYDVADIPAFRSDEGETVVTDDENGIWIYQNSSLSIVIRRHAAETKRIVWYEADIRVNLHSGERLGVVRIGEDPTIQKHYAAQRILQACQNVFAINSDYHLYRYKRGMDTGVIIRDRQIVFPGGKGGATVFPTLDTLVFFEDGSLKTFYAREHSAQEYLDMDAVHVFSFGPILVREGELCFPYFSSSTANEPRCGLGMIEPGHYLAVMVEGRLSRSQGCDMQDLANLFMARGCVEALNLDGGGTAAMCFMGKIISSIGNYGNRTARTQQPRSMSELIGVGTSQQVPGVNDP